MAIALTKTQAGKVTHCAIAFLRNIFNFGFSYPVADIYSNYQPCFGSGDRNS
ncbi:MAG: hypothetical protein AAFY63_11190 [Cyanobacteria bacterium J06643_13]